MAGNLTDFAENKLLDHITGRATYTKPTNVYFGLFLVVPDDDGTGGTEVNAADYERQVLSWGAAVSGAIAIDDVVRFPETDDAASNWGTILGVGIWDTLTAGNLLWYGTLAANVTINSGDSWSLTSGSVTLTLD